VSPQWKASQLQPFTPEAFVEIRLTISPASNVTQQVQTNGIAMISDPTLSLLNGTSIGDNFGVVSCATLELNRFLLDGSSSYTDNAADQTYLSDVLSGEDGTFSKHPTFSVIFGAVAGPFAGISIAFDTAGGGHPMKFTVAAYNGPGVVFNATFDYRADNTYRFAVTSCDKITIEIYDWSAPWTRARIDAIYAGIIRTYDKDDLMSFSPNQLYSPLSSELPKSEVQFSLDNTSDEFTPLSPRGITNYLKENLMITTRYGYDLDGAIEWIPGGKYYLSEWKAASDGLSADFTARDILGLMSVEPTVEIKDVGFEFAAAISELETWVYESTGYSPQIHFPERVGSLVSASPMPQGTCAEILQYIANAAGCGMLVRRDGAIELVEQNYPGNSDYIIDGDVLYSRPEVNLSNPVARATASLYTWSKNDPDEIVNIETMDVLAGELIHIPFDNPVVPASIKITTQNLKSSKIGVYGCDLVYAASQTVSILITGQSLTSASSISSYSLSGTGTVFAADNQLVTDKTMARALAKALYDYQSNREIISLSMRADPRLDAGDAVVYEDSLGTYLALITELGYSFGGAFSATAKATVYMILDTGRYSGTAYAGDRAA